MTGLVFDASEEGGKITLMRYFDVTTQAALSQTSSNDGYQDSLHILNFIDYVTIVVCGI